MTLQEAYDQWQQLPQNRALFAKTREAFRKSWFDLPTNQPCRYYTEEVLGQALAATQQIEASKAKAASVMIHVLTFANTAEPEDNPKPGFGLEQLMAYVRSAAVRPAPKKEAKAKAPEAPAPKKEANAPEVPAPKKEAKVPEAPAPKKEAKAKDSPKTMICQLDMQTLQVVKTWDNAFRIKNELGVSNIARAIERCGVAGGFYWTYAADLDTFRERQDARREHNAQAHSDHCAQMREAKSKTTPAKPKASGNMAGGEAAAPADDRSLAKTDERKTDRRSAAEKALLVFTDEELFAELDRRGWIGCFSRTEVVTIGHEDHLPLTAGQK